MSYTAAENGVMTKGVVSGRGGIDLRLRRIMSNPSQTLRRRLVRTKDVAVVIDACRRPSRLCFSQFATLKVDHTIDLYAAKPDICQESRF